jgi:uncharacterized protein YukE
MSGSGAPQQLASAWQNLKHVWQEVKDVWKDKARHDFERDYWNQLEREMPAMQAELARLTDVCSQARRTVR